MEEKLSKEEHRNRHKELDFYLSELFSDFLNQKKMEHGSIMELLAWSHEQAIEPDHEG